LGAYNLKQPEGLKEIVLLSECLYPNCCDRDCLIFDFIIKALQAFDEQAVNLLGINPKMVFLSPSG